MQDKTENLPQFLCLPKLLLDWTHSLSLLALEGMKKAPHFPLFFLSLTSTSWCNKWTGWNFLIFTSRLHSPKVKVCTSSTYLNKYLLFHSIPHHALALSACPICCLPSYCIEVPIFWEIASRFLLITNWVSRLIKIINWPQKFSKLHARPKITY